MHASFKFNKVKVCHLMCSVSVKNESYCSKAVVLEVVENIHKYIALHCDVHQNQFFSM